ncbi:unnamed protein product, partial [Timema podura]|nr:unnamed protein product [Timema podura]
MEKELREAFRLYDKEGNGYIPTSCLREILRELDDQLTSDELDMMIEEIDSDGSGTVDFDVDYYKGTIHGDDDWLNIPVLPGGPNDNQKTLTLITDHRSHYSSRRKIKQLPIKLRINDVSRVLAVTLGLKGLCRVHRHTS